MYTRHFLVLTDSGRALDHAKFLDLEVKKDRYGWYTSVYSKWNEPKFAKVKERRVRFPAVGSTLSKRSAYGTVTSELHRFVTNDMRKGDFISHTAELLHWMHWKKGYVKAQLWNKVCTFLPKHPHMYGVESNLTLRNKIIQELNILDFAT